MPEVINCQRCGSTSFEDVSTNKIKCSHCGTVFNKFDDEPAVIIGKGANVVIGKTANVEIRGDLKIQEGANLDIQGQVVIIDEDETQEE